ncbi:MAG: TlpA family protein disulfide reductase [Pseudonocardiaceae bacterium]
MALVIALWVVVLGLIALVLGLSRRVRELSDRFASGPAGQDMAKGPKVGSIIELAPPDSSRAAEDDIEAEARVVLFLSTSCGPCHSLGDEIVAARNDGFALVGSDLVLVTDELGAEFYRELRADDVLVQPANEIARRLGINATPYGVAVDASGVVRWSGVPHHLDDVRSMASALAINAL